MLRADGITKYFGGLRALNAVDLRVTEGTIHAIIGPNGAGKTTLVNCITGMYTADRGVVTYNGRDITGIKSHKLLPVGIGRTFQQSQIVPGLSVMGNILLGRTMHRGYRAWEAFLRTPSFRRLGAREESRAIQAGSRVGLSRELLQSDVSELNHEQLGLVGIARALVGEPNLLLLDEPTAGMARSSKERMVEVLSSIREDGVTQVLIEHDLGFIRKLTDEATVLNFGENLARGSVSEVLSNPQVIEAYVGTSEG